MLTTFLVVCGIVFCLLHIDKILYLKYVPTVIWESIKAIPMLCYAGLKTIEAFFLYLYAGILYSFYLALTWCFWPLALWLIYVVQIKPYTK